MSLDLPGMSDDVFDEWLRDTSGYASERNLSEERLVELVGTTLREETPEFRAKGFVDLANLCYAMADKALGSQTRVRKCLEVVVSVGQRH